MNAFAARFGRRPVPDQSDRNVIAFAVDRLQAGKEVAIATLSAIHGSSPRKLGAQMAISSDNEHNGSISSGCLERAIVAEAIQVIKRKELRRKTRYGKGSDFFDIVLPCGAGVEILYTNCMYSALSPAEPLLERRMPFTLKFGGDGVDVLDRSDRTGWLNDAFLRCYDPPLKIIVAAMGVEAIIFSQIATSAGYDILTLSPDPETLVRCAGETMMLRSRETPFSVEIDPYTAFVSLMHERDWDEALLSQALASDAFYVGAVGGQKTQSGRREVLASRGVPDAHLGKLIGPVGLIPSTREPSVLAISILAEIVQQWMR